MPIPNKKPLAIARIQTHLQGIDQSLFAYGLYLPFVETSSGLTLILPWKILTLLVLQEMPGRIDEGINTGLLTQESRVLVPGQTSIFGLQIADSETAFYYGYESGMEVQLTRYLELDAEKHYEKLDELHRGGRRKPEGN